MVPPSTAPTLSRLVGFDGCDYNYKQFLGAASNQRPFQMTAFDQLGHFPPLA